MEVKMPEDIKKLALRNQVLVENLNPNDHKEYSENITKMNEILDAYDPHTQERIREKLKSKYGLPDVVKGGKRKSRKQKKSLRRKSRKARKSQKKRR
jgi:hypothetical protein